jgi:hypothetical protein
LQRCTIEVEVAMMRFALITLVVGTVVLVTSGANLAQMSQDKEVLLQQLGPNPLFGAPESLAQLVNQAHAAVVADIVAPGEIRLQAVANPYSKKPTKLGYATYRAVIRDIVYNRIQASAPPLSVGSEVEFTQRVGREQAEAFLAKHIPVVPGDQCLLFLFLDRGATNWSMLVWPLQFRKSHKLPGTAETLGPSAAMTYLDAKWLGESVPVTLNGEAVLPNWDNLVTEVRRLALQPMAR